MLKNQANIKTHPKNLNDKYHDFHCRVLKTLLFEEINVVSHLAKFPGHCA